MHQNIHELELSLLDPMVRKSSEKLDYLIGDTFLEFGSSGKIYNKNQVIDLLVHEEPETYQMTNFASTELAADVILTTYKVSFVGHVSLRSSIWKLRNGNWKIVFHQGTRCDQ